MRVILYMAVSSDGYIATKEGDSDWVSEADKDFEKNIEEAGCIILGKKTFDQYYGDLYPFEDTTNIVLTKNSEIANENENVVFASSPSDAIKIAKEKGHDKAILVGGGIVNGAFLESGLIDEIFLSVHPLILGEGIKIFENFGEKIDLEFVGSKNIEEGLVQLHYKVSK